MRSMLVMLLAAAGMIGRSATCLLAAGPSYTDAAEADEDFQFQGEYRGQIDVGGQLVRLGVQTIALGKGRFRAVSYVGGLPGDGWDGSEKRASEGVLVGDEVRLEGTRGQGTIKAGRLDLSARDGDVRGSLEKVQRRSPTLGQPPPADAVVLFDGTTASHFRGGKMSSDRLLLPGSISKATFHDHRVHIEFRLPYEPEDRGQQRGNSGIYLQGRYEVQMLDSFGLAGKNNECGGIYEIKDPDQNMCFPPLSWQTYDIVFTAARYDDARKRTANPRITVRHNGVLIHDDVELPGERSTRAAPLRTGPGPGPLYLQDHGDPVRYRNIWVVE